MPERTVRVHVRVMLKTEIADVKGVEKLRNLKSNGFSEVSEVKEGQLIELTLRCLEDADIENRVKEMCDELLCNSTTSNYDFEVIE